MHQEALKGSKSIYRYSLELILCSLFLSLHCSTKWPDFCANLKTGFFGIQAHIHEEDNNSQFKTFFNQNYNRSSFILDLLTVFKTMPGFPISNISWIWDIVVFSRQKPLSRFYVLSVIQNKPHIHNLQNKSLKVKIIL